MNWNGQRSALDHLIARRTDRSRANQLQADFDSKRKAKIQSALCCRPVYLPLEFAMNAAGQVSAYRATTPSLGYDVIITGIKSDSNTRDILIRRNEENKPLVYVGEETNLYLRVDDLSGTSATNGGGQIGAFYLPSPLLISAGARLTVEMFKTDTTADPEEANIVLIGVRVFSKGYGDELLDTEERQRIEFFTRAREVPEVKLLKQSVSFDQAGAGGIDQNLLTPQVEEPLLIRGVRTTLRHSLIELNIQGEPSWTPQPTPIWAVAGEDELIYENYQWFAKPIYLHSRNTIEITKITNSIDGTNIDSQTGNTITWICETV